MHDAQIEGVLVPIVKILGGLIFGNYPSGHLDSGNWTIQPVLNTDPTPCRMLIPVKRIKAIQPLIVAAWVWFLYSAGDESGVSRTTWAAWNLVILPVLAYWFWKCRSRWEWRDFGSCEDAREFMSLHIEGKAKW